MITDNSIDKIVAQIEKDELERRARNFVLMQSNDFLVMLVIGPNRRTDFHFNNTAVSESIASKNYTSSQ